MGRLFGTDGVRGVAGDDLTGRLAMDLAIAAAEVLHEAGVFDRARAEGRRPLAVVGRDPRASGEFLESAVVAGLASVGMTPRRSTSTPAPARPATTAASRNSPEARGSRPTTATRRPPLLLPAVAARISCSIPAAAAARSMAS